MMNFSKEALGKKLKALVSSKCSINDIAKWAFNISLYHSSEMAEDLIETLERLSYMEAGPEFQYTYDDLDCIADKLVEEGQKEELLKSIPAVKEKANELDQNWLSCPCCQESWESQSTYGIVKCPKCKKKLHNPRHLQSKDDLHAT